MKRNLSIVPFLALVLFTCSCGEASTETEKTTTETTAKEPAPKETTSKIIVDVNSIAGKSAADIEAVLGKPESTEKASPSGTPCKTNPCDKSVYQSGKYEIIFINGKSDWITINNLSDYTLDAGNIELLGLPASEPAFNNPANVISWEGVNGITKISFFNNGSGKIDYADIKVATN